MSIETYDSTGWGQPEDENVLWMPNAYRWRVITEPPDVLYTDPRLENVEIDWYAMSWEDYTDPEVDESNLGGWHCGRRVISGATTGLFSRAVWNWLRGSFSDSDGRLCTAEKPGYCCGGATILGMCSGMKAKAVSRSRWPSMARSMLSAGIPRQMSLVNGGQR